MKIAYITDVAYPYVKGGSEKRLWELAKRLAGKNEVHIYCTNWHNSNVKDAEDEGVLIHFITKANELYTRNGKRSIRAATRFALSVAYNLLPERFDIIDCNQSPMLHAFSGKLVSVGRCRFIITFHEVWGDYWYEYLGKFGGFFGKTLEKIITTLPDKLVATSNRTKRELVRSGVNPERIFVIPNGVDVEEIQRSRKFAGDYDVVYVGRLVKTKNVHCLIESLWYLVKDLPDIRCAIVGWGPEINRLRFLTSKLGIEGNVHFFGELETQEVFSVMKSSKMLVSCSVREGFGITFLEANACGLPVICIKSPANAANEIVQNGQNGFSIELSPGSISKTMLFLLKNDSLREKMGRIGARLAAEYDWNKIAINVFEVYESAISS